MAAFRHIQRIILDAETFSYSTKDSPIYLDRDTLDREIDYRSILQTDRVAVTDIPLLGGVTRRFLPNVGVFILVTEKEAMFGAPYLNGSIDYCSFLGSGPDFRSWCRELFLHFWEEAKPNPSLSS